MTTATHLTVEEFLRRYEAPEAGSAGQAQAQSAADHIRQWVQSHPAGALALVKDAQAAQTRLKVLDRERERQERAQRMGLKAGPSQEELLRQSQAWDRLLGTGGARRPQASATPLSPSPAAPRRPTFEDVGARFMMAHVGKAWLALGVVAAIVIATR